ncbi:hypothetical protein OSTOST_22536, partial [Ostertagia ostertagi]
LICPHNRSRLSCISFSTFSWSSLICTRCASTPDCPCVENMSQRSNSAENSEESIAERTVATSVIRDTGTKVQLLFKAHGLKKRKSLLNSIVTVFKKPHSPSRLLSNGKFTKFDLKPHSIHFIL